MQGGRTQLLLTTATPGLYICIIWGQPARDCVLHPADLLLMGTIVYWGKMSRSFAGSVFIFSMGPRHTLHLQKSTRSFYAWNSHSLKYMVNIEAKQISQNAAQGGKCERDNALGGKLILEFWWLNCREERKNKQEHRRKDGEKLLAGFNL